MIKLNRTKDKWILQKNISSTELMEAYLKASNDQDNIIDKQSLQASLREKGLYTGRTENGSLSTMGVRFSQMCFYMFGYKKNNNFIPSATTQALLRKRYDKRELMLVNLFSMQFPHPYSDTSEKFKIYFGRLILKLLLDDRLQQKLYIDECIWFLPFIQTINETLYEDLVNSILEYRALQYSEKLEFFQSVEHYDEIFSNCLHELKYYFFNIFEEFGVLKVIDDPLHNNGQLFIFKHGKTTTRNDAYASHKKHSGYVTIVECLKEKALLLLNNYNFCDTPSSQGDSLKEQWLEDLYELSPIKYIRLLRQKSTDGDHIISTISKMLELSKFGNNDGKDFEKALKDCFDLFREVKKSEIISGSGDTDIVCCIEDNEGKPYKINVDAKKTGKAVQSLVAKRLIKHLDKNRSKYCIVVAPRFAKGAIDDIAGDRIVAIEAETLGRYISKDCLSSDDGFSNFDDINKIIEQNCGRNITKLVDNKIDEIYSFSLKDKNN